MRHHCQRLCKTQRSLDLDAFAFLLTRTCIVALVTLGLQQIRIFGIGADDKAIPVVHCSPTVKVEACGTHPDGQAMVLLLYVAQDVEVWASAVVCTLRESYYTQQLTPLLR